MALPLYWYPCVADPNHTGVPVEGERHGPGNTMMVVVVVAVEPVCHHLDPARLGAICPVGSRHGAVLGRASHAPNPDRPWPGIALARPGALCGVGGLGPGGGGTPTASADCTSSARPVGPLSSGRAR